jgi:hypothetical protein
MGGRCRTAAFIVLAILLASPLTLLAQAKSSKVRTKWVLKPSLKYDALCLLNVLSGDPYYMEYYKAEYDRFHSLFTPEEQAAFVRLKQVFKDDAHGIISARLALYFSAVDDETLPEMIRTADDSSKMKVALQQTPYWDPESWEVYEKARPALRTALRALERVGFAKFWDANARPKIEARIAEISPQLPKYDIIPLIETHLGFALPSDSITVYLLSYSEPHGIRITGLRFLTHVSYPFDIVLHNAIHESMHPPYNASDPRVAKAIATLGSDPIVREKVEHHDTSFGYNSPAGYIEEDSVQALEQIVSEEVGVARNACEYWNQQDGGMHVLATAIYTEYRKSSKPFSEWLVDATTSGELTGPRLQQVVEQFAKSCRK